jgi:cytochrome c peroxidase
MFKTLRQVIDYYDNPSSIVPNPINRDTSLDKPLNLTEQEKQDLEAFLISLTGSK